MTLNQLEYFCIAVQCDSITLAAKRLYISQPAVSGAIKELEKEFSVKLYSRNKNKLVLTEDGQRFYERAVDLLREVEAAKHQLQDLGNAEIQLKVGIPPLWGTTFFPDLLNDFNAEFPNIRLTFFEYGSSKACLLVQDGTLDIALANMSHADGENLNSVHIGRDRFVIAISPNHVLAKKKKVSLQELAEVPLIMYNTDSVQNFSITSLFKEMGISPNIVVYTSQIYTMKSLLHNGTCASFFYESLLQDHPDIIGIPIEPAIEQQVGLVWKKRKYTPLGVDSFIKFVQDYPLFTLRRWA